MKLRNICKDIISGIIVALISIPISMGYAEIAGLPAIYGLYGSLFPILIFGIITTSHDFVFGVDAAPAALTGSAIMSIGIVAGSDAAARIVPLITFLVAIFLFLFSLINAGRVVKYISTPVMGGFITGICLEIILMQLPKLFGGVAGTGELPELLIHIWEETGSFNPWSLLLGGVTILILLISRKFIPKVPMSVVVMIIGALMTIYTPIRDYGVKTLPEVARGLPEINIPFSGVSLSDVMDIVFAALTISVVIMAETLLASSQNAMNDGYRLNPRREVAAYAAANLASSLSGSCPVNASVSRTTLVRQFGCISQLMSVTASIMMGLILIFFTGFIEYLPVPVLTGIVISALLSACEFHLAARLIESSRTDFYIFISAMLGVLLFGTIYGVLIGVVLSFIAVIIRTVTPPRGLLGIIPGHEGFYSLSRNSNARPVHGAVIYRFSGNLFFGNIDTFQQDIEASITPDTKCIIVYGSGIGSIDITAADRLIIINRSLKERGIRFFLTEHEGKVNDELRRLGADELIRTGAVRLTVDTALRVSSIRKPYPVEGGFDRNATQLNKELRAGSALNSNISGDGSTLLTGLNAELEWAFGEESDAVKRDIADSILQHIVTRHDVASDEQLVSAEKDTAWGRLAYFDEDEILEMIEKRLSEMDGDNSITEDRKHIVDIIEHRRRVLEEHIKSSEISSLNKLRERRKS